ncbi:MAG: ABC transporter substrate-binding protein, partial [Candidatus Binatia bacterium]
MLKHNKKDLRCFTLVLILCAVSLVHVGLTSAQGKLDWQKKWQSLLDRAKKEGRVVVYGPPGEQIRNGIVQGFTKIFPDLTVEYVGATGTEHGTKIRSERDAGIYSLDVYLGGVSTISRILLPLKAFDPITDSLVLPEVTDVKNWRDERHHFGDKGGRFNLIYVSMVSPKLIYNPGQVKREDVDELHELVDPKWKGKIVTHDPTGPGPGANYYRHIWLSLGAQKATEHFKRIRAHAVIDRDQRRAIESVARGKYAMFLAPSSGVLEQLRPRGLKFEVLEEFKDIGGHMTASFGSLGLMNRAPHPNAAVVFINWLLGKEGQLVWSRAVNAVSRRVDVPTDHLPRYSIPNPKTKYWDSDSEAASA